MPAPRTTTTCLDCGNEIPESLLDDALCVSCRYDGPIERITDCLDEDGLPTLTDLENAANKQAVSDYLTDEPPDLPAGDQGEARKEFQEKLCVLAECLMEARTPKTAWHKVHVFAHLMLKSGCKTDSELAAKLNISAGRLSQIRAEIAGIFPSLARCNARQN